MHRNGTTARRASALREERVVKKKKIQNAFRVITVSEEIIRTGGEPAREKERRWQQTVIQNGKCVGSTVNAVAVIPAFAARVSEPKMLGAVGAREVCPQRKTILGVSQGSN